MQQGQATQLRVLIYMLAASQVVYHYVVHTFKALVFPCHSMPFSHVCCAKAFQFGG